MWYSQNSIDFPVVCLPENFRDLISLTEILDLGVDECSRITDV